MKLLKIILKIIIWIVFICLSLIGIWSLVNGGWTTLSEKFQSLDKNFWEFIKWFFSSMFGKQ